MQRLSLIATRRVAAVVPLSCGLRFASSGAPSSSSTDKASSSTASEAASAAADGHSHSAAESAALIFESLKKKDFGTAQAQAMHLAQSGASDEYAVPAACLLALLITFYWARSSHRSAVRRCDQQAAFMASVAGDLSKRVEDVSNGSVEALAKRSKAMETVQQANGELTTVIDQMTAALRTC